MGFQFRKSIKIMPGVRLNVGTKSVGMSFGGKGLRYSINSSGRKTATIGIPNTGISYSVSSSGRKYKSSAYQRNQQLKQQRALEKLEQMERDRLELELYMNKLEMIDSIHKECDDFCDWDEIVRRPSPTQVDGKGPNELAAVKKLEGYKAGVFTRLLGREKKETDKLKEAIETARKEDIEEYQSWEDLHNLAKRVLEGDVDAYFKVIEEMRPLDDLLEFGSGFEFSTDDPSYLEVDFAVKSDDVIPPEILSVTKTGKLTRKNMNKTMFYDIQQDYVCACSIRIARDLFALLPIQTVVVHANDMRLNTATGHEELATILSVKFDRKKLESLNFDAIDCSDSMINFDHHMKFLKTKGLQAVSRLTP